MMLDMLTADHHHSPPRCAPSPANGSFLQMPFSLLGNVLRKQNAPVPPAVAKVESPGPVPDASTPPTNPMKTDSEAPISPTTSRPASVSSAASDGDRRKKRGARPKTTYKLAQPPPSSHQKLHIRPKILLQLHQVVASSRPRPVYEVIPYSILAPVSTRRLARTFRKDKLGAQDLLIVKAEEYGNNNDDAKSDDERWGSRDVVGIICPGKEEKGHVVNTEVMMDNGSSWEVKAAPNGGYEFSYTDDHGLMVKARWITKPSISRTQSITSSSTAATPDTRKFKFSTISANSRRHPVIATMTRDRIEVFDSYTMPSATSPTTPSHPSSALPTPATPSIIDIESFMDKENLPVMTDDALRRFIVASGIWVAFCENWSPAYSSSKASCLTPLATQIAPRPAPPNRSISMTFVDTPRSASPSSIIDENKRTIPRIIRTGTQLLHRNASFDVSPKKASPSSSPTIKTRGRRSNSTGNAEIQSGNGSTKKRFGLGLGGQPLTETDEERQSKRSSELLRIKELSMPNSPSSPSQALTPIPSADPAVSERSLSRASSNPRTKKARSAYNPVTTAGLWDSGVSNSKGLKARPTSMVVVQEKKKKARRKEARSRSKEREKEKPKEKKEKTPRRKSEGFKQLFSGIFRRDKVAA